MTLSARSRLLLVLVACWAAACDEDHLAPRSAPGSPPPYAAAAAPGAQADPAARPQRMMGHVAFGSPALRGGQIPGAQGVLAATAAGVNRCYLHGLQQSPTLAGSLTLRLAIGPTGQVLSVTPGAVSGLSQELVACLVQGYQQVVFPPPDGATEATLDLPITFSPVEAPRPRP